MHKILISGYYGFNNIGDEAILKGLLEGIRERLPLADIVVLSKFPDFTSKKHNVRAINRINLFKIMREMRSMDLLVSGGGSLFQDVTSKRSIVYYLGIIWLAKKNFRKKVMIYSQGIGPVLQPYNRHLLGRILDDIDVINVRDEKSKQELLRLGVTKEILVTTDTVFNISKPSGAKGEKILGKIDRRRDKAYIGISVRRWGSHNERIKKETAWLCEKIVRESSHRPVMIPFHFHQDLSLMKEIHAMIPQDIRSEVLIMQEYLYVEDYLSLIGQMDLMVAMRLHGLIFSALMEVCPVGISYDPKIHSFMQMLHQSDTMNVEEMDAEQLFLQIQSILADKENKVRELRQHLKKLKDIAQKHNDRLIELLEA